MNPDAQADGQRIKGWYTRGYLPHCDDPDKVQFVTFRLADSLPQALLEEWDHELHHWPQAERNAEWRLRAEMYIDQGYGECRLAVPAVAEIVERSFLEFAEDRYELLAWCIMPNHVHVLVHPAEAVSLPSLVQSWKKFTARQANRLASRSGTFWHRDFFDRYMRDARRLSDTIQYIEGNPVVAGLCTAPDRWPWSSARRRIDGRIVLGDVGRRFGAEFEIGGPPGAPS